MVNQFPNSIWRDPRADAILRENRGKIGATRIAMLLSAELGVPVTRNSVVGRAHRLGLSSQCTGGYHMSHNSSTPRPPRNRPQRRPDGFTRNPGDRMAPSMPPPPEVPDAPPEKRLTLQQLERNTCRYVIGTVGEPEWGFCPEKKTDGSSYCHTHKIRCTNVYYK